jgi:hypothetical protein
MATETQIADFGRMIKQFSSAMLEAIEAESKPGWQFAYLDIRSAPDGSYRDVKLRVVQPDGIAHSVQTTNVMNQIEYQIFQSKFSPPWYGLKLEVTREGNCKVTFNYDPQCCEDETFYDD